MSLGAPHVKEEPGSALTDSVCVKVEPELNVTECVELEPEYVVPGVELGVKEDPACVQLKAVCAGEEPICVIQQVLHVEQEVVHVEQEVERLKEEPTDVQQPACVKEESSWRGRVGSGSSTAPDSEFKYEIPVVPLRPLVNTLDVNPNMLLRDCWVRLERCARAAAAAAAAARPAAAAADFSAEHEREIAMKQLSVNPNSLLRDCWVRLERGAGAGAPAVAVAVAVAVACAPPPNTAAFSEEHERAMKQLNRLMIHPSYACIKNLTPPCEAETHKNVHMKRKTFNKFKHQKLIRSVSSSTSSQVSDLTESTSAPPNLLQNTYSCGILSSASSQVSDRTEPSAPPKQVKETYTCGICQLVFMDIDSFHIHALRQHGSMLTPNTIRSSCNICHEEFPTLLALKKHQRFHEESRPHSCGICKKGFKRAFQLTRHMILMHRAKEECCKGCEKKQALKQLGSLLKCDSFESGDANFCDICNKELT